MNACILKVALDTPLQTHFDYQWSPAIEEGKSHQKERVSDAIAKRAPRAGDLVIVPFGKQQIMGMVVAVEQSSKLAPDKLKNVLEWRHQIHHLRPDWLALCEFAADYYQRSFGEVALPALPKQLRQGKVASLERYLKKLEKLKPVSKATPSTKPLLNSEQQSAVNAIGQDQGFASYLLHGVTGSGKTEVYLQAAEQVLARSNDAQVLILVPEINLTPQLEGNIQQRFSYLQIATLHSGMAEGERLLHWLAAHTGTARIILGTRLAILASLPHLKLIIVDEEHDPSYKQQEGLRYSARDLAVWRAHQLNVPVVLGSATPSLESWQHAKSGRYQKLNLRERAIKDATLPVIRLINLEQEKPVDGLTPRLIDAIRRRMEKGEQSLLFLNRRGYAPVIACDACGWISNCVRCSAHLVMHKLDQRLRCHHCGWEQKIPHRCPTCGNIDLQPLGRGTQRMEEGLQKIFPAARICRIDADSTRRKGSAETAFESVHRGEVDILIGTQMVAKGHDFKNLSLVAALNPDSALFSQDYRASERLFAQLMQVAGRAGRAAQKEGGNFGEVLIQTRYPDHPLYHALIAHDYERFADSLLEERQQAHLPPLMYQALLRADAKELPLALAFLHEAAHCLQWPDIVINDPIPMTMMRVANRERAQLLVESASRPALQAFLKEWLACLRAMKTRVKWHIEIDPLDI